ncbi:MAG: alpha/beta hydrolase [Polyangiaceae bacterium]
MASPERERIIAMLRMLPRELPTRDNVPLMRTLLDAAAGRSPRGTEVEEVDAAGVPAEWVRCGEVDPDRRLLYLHGGAYVTGSRVSHRALAARISRAARVTVLLIDYRLAPEHPHPAALEDAVAALGFMLETGPLGPARARRSFVAGDSAGGGLALATLLSARDAELPLPDAAIALSPWTDLAMTGDSFMSRAGVDPMITPSFMHPCAALYLDATDARHPLASPLYGDLGNLPPLLLHVGDEEVLLDDTRRFAERARAAGVEVTAEVWPEMFHVFHAFAGMLPEGREAIAKIGEFLARWP